MHETELISLAAILGVAVASQLIAAKLRIPSIVLLLVTGFALGVLGLIDPDDLLSEGLLIAFVSLSIGVILFEGGLTLDFRELRQGASGITVLLLVTVGVIITWIGAAAAAWLIFDMSSEIALVLGAVLVVSGPTVVLPILRQIRPRGRVESILRWEGILIDPVGVILAVLVFEAVVAGQESNYVAIFQRFGINMGYGIAVGIAAAIILLTILRYARLRPEQEVALTLAMVVVAFAAADVLAPEAGLVSATLMGVLMANQRLPIIGWGRPIEVRHILSFKETVGLLLTGVLFVLLAARVDSEELLSLAVPALLFVGVLIVLRIVVAAIATGMTRMNVKEWLFLSWMAPRGIVAASTASIFALSFAELGADDPNLVFEGAEDIATITFLVIVATVVLYGLTAGPLARVLGITNSGAPRVLIVGAHSWGRRLAATLEGQKIPVTMWTAHPANARLAKADGIECFSDDLLSADAHSHPRLNEIGLVLILTDNVEFNRLAAEHLKEFVLRTDIFEVRSASGGHAVGLPAFDESATTSALAAWYAAEAKIETVPLEERWEPRTDDVPLMLVQPGRSVKVLTNRKAIGAKPKDERSDRPETIPWNEIEWDGERRQRRRAVKTRDAGSVVIAMTGARTNDPEAVDFTA